MFYAKSKIELVSWLCFSVVRGFLLAARQDSAQPLLFLSHSLSGGTEKAAPFIWDAAGQHQ